MEKKTKLLYLSGTSHDLLNTLPKGSQSEYVDKLIQKDLGKGKTMATQKADIIFSPQDNQILAVVKAQYNKDTSQTDLFWKSVSINTLAKIYSTHDYTKPKCEKLVKLGWLAIPKDKYGDWMMGRYMPGPKLLEEKQNG